MKGQEEKEQIESHCPGVQKEGCVFIARLVSVDPMDVCLKENSADQTNVAPSGDAFLHVQLLLCRVVIKKQSERGMVLIKVRCKTCARNNLKIVQR